MENNRNYLVGAWVEVKDSIPKCGDSLVAEYQIEDQSMVGAMAYEC